MTPGDILAVNCVDAPVASQANTPFDIGDNWCHDARRMGTTVPSRSSFGEKLRRELDQRGMSIRKLARTMNPSKPEQARRNLARWIGGYNEPSRVQLVAVCNALGVPLETFDEEEDDPVMALMAAIRRVVRDELARQKEPSA